MKKINLLMGLLLISSAAICQIGIGTQTPNTKSLLDLNSTTKGLLLPRMSASDRTAMPLTSTETGMAVYQTTSPKGIYSFDGSNWMQHAGIDAGVVNGSTPRWDGTRWIASSYLFNSGSAVALGMTSPNFQFQINSSNQVPHTRLQLTNTGTSGNFTGATATDGLILGIGANIAQGEAHLIQNENKPLWFATNGLERLRIDSAGRVGINTLPNYQLHVNGSGNEYARIQLTSPASATSLTDGLVIGMGNNTLPGTAHIINQENKPLVLGTNNTERMRIDSAGRVGINVAPASQLQVNTTMGDNSRLQLTSAATSSTATDGLVIGIGNNISPGTAHIINQENNALVMGTNNTERMRIEADGRIGIGTPTPAASTKLDVNGQFKLGTSGTTLSGIIRADVSIDPPLLNSMQEWETEVPMANTSITGVAYVSPSSDLAGYAICYARISSPGTLKIKLIYMGAGTSNLDWITLRVAVIQ